MYRLLITVIAIIVLVVNTLLSIRPNSEISIPPPSYTINVRKNLIMVHNVCDDYI